MRWPGRRGGDRDAFGHESSGAPGAAAPDAEHRPRGAEANVVGVLLAAGSATRFGSAKQLADYRGRPLVEHAFDALVGVEAVDVVVVVVGAYGAEVTGAVEAADYGDLVEVVACPDHEQGISASLRCGLAAARARGADAIVVHLADLPLVGTRAVEAVVLDAFDAEGHLHDVPTRATFSGRDGHPVVFPQACFPALEALTGDTGARDLLARLRTRRLEVGDLADPIDIDTPDQLEALPP